MRKNLIVLSAIIAVTAMSCKTAKIQDTVDTNKTEQAMHDQLNGSWKLAYINPSLAQEKSLKDLFPGKTPALHFDIAGKSVNGNDGCNNIFGSYQTSGLNGITIGDKLAATMMFCQGVSDQLFMSALKQTTKFTIEQGQLIFSNKDQVIAKFDQVVDLVDTQWELTFIQTKDRSAFTLQDRFPMGIPTLSFTGETVSGNAGCNNFSGGYSIENEELAFGELATTMMLCDGVDDSLFLNNLNNAPVYKIENGELVLAAKDGLVLLRFKKK